MSRRLHSVQRLIMIVIAMGTIFNGRVNADEQPEPFKRSPFWHPLGRVDGAQVIQILDTSLEIQVGKGKPVTIKLSEVLASGKIEKDADDAYAYGRNDLKVGDVIAANLKEQNSEHVIFEIKLLRRPNGKLPPSQRPDPTDPYHEWKNAWIDFHDHGIPYPRHLCIRYGVFPNGKPVPHPDFWKNILNPNPPEMIPLIKD